ncbi:MAG: hypothetical protein KDB22_04930, partial [Planctomycetales bacterium]|nr:hypothetical protein [Planctomycetales bacterium]
DRHSAGGHRQIHSFLRSLEVRARLQPSSHRFDGTWRIAGTRCMEDPQVRTPQFSKPMSIETHIN